MSAGALPQKQKGIKQKGIKQERGGPKRIHMMASENSLRREPGAASQRHAASQHNSAEPLVDRRAYHKPRSVDDLTERNVQTIVQLEEAARENRTASDHVVDAVSRFCGSIAFVWAHAAVFGLWIIVNVAPIFKAWRFDPFPFFFLSFIVALEAIFLSTFILISQNRQQQLSERRNHLNLQISLLAEHENTKMLQMLNQIAQAVGADINDEPDVRILEEATRPDRLLEQIDQSIEEVEKSKRAALDGTRDGTRDGTPE